jgi:hypothetical protein
LLLVPEYHGTAALAGAICGTIGGVFLIPVTVAFLVDIPLRRAVTWISLPCLLPSAVLGLFPSDPLLSLIIVAGIFVGLTVYAHPSDANELDRSFECEYCGYDLRGLSTAQCPECGKFPGEAPESPSTQPQSVREQLSSSDVTRT